MPTPMTDAIVEKSVIFDFGFARLLEAVNSDHELCHNIFEMPMLRKQKQLLKKVVNRTPLPAWYAFDGDLTSLRKKIGLYFEFAPSKRKEHADEIAFLNSEAKPGNHWSFLFPYSFVFNYDHRSVQVHRDESIGLFYVIHKGKRLYYSRRYSSEVEVQHAYNGISVEQDERSPHCYTDEEFYVEEGDVVVDVGAAEGNFSLDVIEKASVVYIVEPDSDWIEALNATFRPWKSKVRIINKYASDTDNDTYVSLSGILGDNPVNFIKMDVGGAEAKIITSSEKLLNANPSVKLALCTYHRKGDADATEKILARLGFSYRFTDGYMLYLHTNLTPPYFRRTLVRARK